MISLLLEPFSYDYMVNAMAVCALVGAVCGFLSSYLMLKGWSLMGDALSHAIVPGVALAYVLGIPYAFGAFFAGILAALSMVGLRRVTALKEDVVIGVVFTAFFALGLLIVSIRPTSVNLQAIILGNILAISREDLMQVLLICSVCLVVLLVKWRDFLIVFFDHWHARVLGIRVDLLQVVFFTILSAACVAALQTVGACLVIALVVTPGATAYLLTDRFGVLAILAVVMGALTSFIGVYVSFFLNMAPGGIIVVLQTVLFFTAFFLAPRHGAFAKGLFNRLHPDGA